MRRFVSARGCGLLILALASLVPASVRSADWREWPLEGSGAQPLPEGPAWFRAWLRAPDALVDPTSGDLWRNSMTLTLQDLPGPVTVLLNGRPIVETRDIPEGVSRRFKVPKGILEKGVANALVIRIEGKEAPGGLRVPPVFAGYFDEVVLDRPWEAARAEPGDGELRATAEPAGAAVYTASDFRPATTVLHADPEPERGRFVPPDEALRLLRAGEDLVVEELLHEPEVAQPTHVSFDARGRMWVAQYRQYPYPAGVQMISRDKFYRAHYDRVPPPPPHHDPGADVISVHEDRDRDGVYETHRQVLRGLNLANAVVSGHGGWWVMQPPYLLFYPEADGDDLPDGPPEVRLQGFGLEDTHSVANGLAWGPDGWLYGAQGSTTTSRVTRPGLDPPEAPGAYVEGCMVWRYHPERRDYEIFADGSGNTFGVSFDAEGRLFTGHNGGDTRGWHHVQEGIYLKQGNDPGKFGPPANPFAFGEMPMMRSTHPVPRFTHLTLVADGTALPERWRGLFFAADPLHHRLVAAQRLREGSTFATTDAGVPLQTEDMTFRPVYLANAPDGSLVVADFREEYIAHGQHYQSQIDPGTGRIYRLRGRDLPLETDVDLSNRSAGELVALLDHPNLWHRQTAVRLLGERREPQSEQLLLRGLERPETHPALECLWALHQMGSLDGNTALRLLDHPAPMVRAWTIRLMGDARALPDRFAEALAAKAAREPDPEVRGQILSTARRLPAAQALPLLREAANRGEDLEDPFIPLLAWFVLESHCAEWRELVLALFDDPAFWRAPLVRRHLTPRLMRRFAASGARQELAACAWLLRRAPSQEDRAALMEGFAEAFRGRVLPSLPEELLEALAVSGGMTLALRVRQGDAAAVADALGLVADRDADPAERLALLQVLGEARQPTAVPVLLGVVLGDHAEEARRAACSALQAYDDPEIAARLLENWPRLPGEVRGAALHLLASRASWAWSLLEAAAAGAIPREAFSSELVGQLRQHADEAVRSLLASQFPDAPSGGQEIRTRIEEVRRILASGAGDPYAGEPLFATRCGSCHTLFFKGGKTGPDLTSYQRDDLGAMLASILDPDAEIREGYAHVVIRTEDGRTLAGFVSDEDAGVVLLRGLDGADVVLRREEIAGLEPVGRSLMPPGLLDGLSATELRDLFAYLRQSQPISR